MASDEQALAAADAYNAYLHEHGLSRTVEAHGAALDAVSDGALPDLREALKLAEGQRDRLLEAIDSWWNGDTDDALVVKSVASTIREQVGG